MNSRLELAQDKVIEGIGKLCDSFGLNRFIAQLYALLYLSDKPLSLDEIASRFKVSKGSVSINIRELENWGAVKNVWIKGSRKDYYEANLDVKRVILDKVKSGIQKRVNEISGMIGEFQNIVRSPDAQLTEEDKRLARIYEERLKKIEELKALALSALSFADKLF